MTVSLDGAKAETHERSRRGSQFAQVMEVFAQCQSERRARPNTQCHLSISTVVNRLNLDEVGGILEIAAQYGIGTLALINPGVGDRTDAFAGEAIGRFPDLFASRIGAIVERARMLGVHLAYPDLPSDEPSAPRNSQESGRGGLPGRLFPGRCLDPWTMAYIDVDGWVRPCCRALWIGMGNILAENFRDIWNNEHYRNLRGSVNTNNPPEFCRTCGANSGINRGDERQMERLRAKGIALPQPPRIGITENR
jgi:radical SAM protein with 4Fe4S-binding SPASM domain